MNLKICSKCGKSKSLSEFYFRKKGPRKGKYYEKCKECMKIRGRSYYQLNRDRQLKLAVKRRNKYRGIMRKYLARIKAKPCIDCGKSFPSYVMDFDHVEGEKKDREITRMVLGGWSKKNVDKEIKKCELVCANCHRIRTYKRLAGLAKVVKAGV